jgi:hypothetical protein
LSVADQINYIKHRIYSSNEPTIQIEEIDRLAAYGTQAADAINEIINSPGIDKQAKTCALVAIENIKKNSS